jgi:hypothetical protein
MDAIHHCGAADRSDSSRIGTGLAGALPKRVAMSELAIFSQLR